MSITWCRYLFLITIYQHKCLSFLLSFFVLSIFLFSSYIFCSFPVHSEPTICYCYHDPLTVVINIHMLVFCAENKKNRSRTIILIVVSIAIVTVLFTFSCYLLRKRTRKSYKTILRENCKYLEKKKDISIHNH